MRRNIAILKHEKLTNRSIYSEINVRKKRSDKTQLTGHGL